MSQLVFNFRISVGRITVPGHSASSNKSECICGWKSKSTTKRGRRSEYTAHLAEVISYPFRACLKCGITKPVELMAVHSPGTCKSCLTKRVKKWGSLNETQWNRQRRESHLKLHFGISVAEYDEIWERQGSKCAICGSIKSDGGKRHHVDHDHKTLKVRGILCGRCNRAIGQFEDDPSICVKAAEYLMGVVNEMH